jgi:probable pyridine nucleotide-disulfide oxidoreductase
VAGTLADQGIDLRLWAPTKAVHRDAGGGIVVSFADGSQVGGNELLVATRSSPVTADLELQAAGVEATGSGFIGVDDHLREPFRELMDGAWHPRFLIRLTG